MEWRLAHDEDLVASGTCRLATCWVQQRVQDGDLRLKKEPGDTNMGNALTKPLDEKRMTNLLTMMGYAFRGGPHSISARSAVTNWRLKSSMSLRRIASYF